MGMLKITKVISRLFIMYPLLARQAFAQTTFLYDPLGHQPLGNFILSISNSIIVPLGVPVATLCVIIGAFYVVVSQGDAEKLNKGKRYILYAAIGYAIVVGATAIKTAICGAVANNTPC